MTTLGIFVTAAAVACWRNESMPVSEKNIYAKGTIQKPGWFWRENSLVGWSVPRIWFPLSLLWPHFFSYFFCVTNNIFHLIRSILLFYFHTQILSSWAAVVPTSLTFSWTRSWECISGGSNWKLALWRHFLTLLPLVDRFDFSNPGTFCRSFYRMEGEGKTPRRHHIK